MSYSPARKGALHISDNGNRTIFKIKLLLHTRLCAKNILCTLSHLILIQSYKTTIIILKTF